MGVSFVTSPEAVTVRARHAHVLGEKARILYKRKVKLTLEGTSSPMLKTLALSCLLYTFSTIRQRTKAPPLWFFSRASLCRLGEDARLQPSYPNHPRGVLNGDPEPHIYHIGKN